jgi:hypothetical protein
MAQPKAPDLAAFLSRIPSEDRLAYLRDEFDNRARLMANGNDPESAAWSALYSYVVCSLEQAMLQRKTGITL